MAIIKLIRTSEYVNMAREYGIYIDNTKVGVIRNGRTGEFDIAPGTHTIYAKIDWCYSPTRTFYVSGSEDTTFKVGAFKNANGIMMLIGVVIAFSFTLYMTLHIYYLSYLLLPIFLGMIYILSIGRKKYLTLTEEPNSP